jgi:uncharacterized protein (TIGR02001 family)
VPGLDEPPSGASRQLLPKGEHSSKEHVTRSRDSDRSIQEQETTQWGGPFNILEEPVMSYRSTSLFGAILLGLAAASEPVHAGVTGSAALTSDYVFRGVSQTNAEPAIQAGFEFSADGWYAGAWGSSISWLSDLSAVGAEISSNVEIDLYGGYRGRFSDEVSFDVGVIGYWYPGDFPSGFNEADTAELYFGVGLGIFSAKYSYALTDLFGYADSDGSGYLDLSANWGFADTWTLNLHAGRQWIESNEDFEYSDWKLGVTKGFSNGFSLALAYTDTNADEALYTNPFGTEVADATLALTVSKAF